MDAKRTEGVSSPAAQRAAPASPRGSTNDTNHTNGVAQPAPYPTFARNAASRAQVIRRSLWNPAWVGASAAKPAAIGSLNA